jgi:hypothetical protein
VSLGRFCTAPSIAAVARRAKTRHFVTHADEYPDQEEGRVQRSIGLGQCADRQVVLVRPVVDAESLPGHDDADECQPGRNAPQRLPCAATAGPGPGFTGWLETGALPFGPGAVPQSDVECGHCCCGDQPCDLRTRRCSMKAAHPTAPGAERQGGHACPNDVATHGAGLSQTTLGRRRTM